MSQKSILFVGPVPPPYHGQSVHFHETYKGLAGYKKFLINQNVTGKNVLAVLIMMSWALLKLTAILIFRKVDIVYFTGSRSKIGTLFDGILIRLASWKKTRIINHLHGINFKSFYDSLSGWWKKYVTKSYQKVDTSIVLLDEMKEQFSDFPNMKIVAIPNFYLPEMETIESKPNTPDTKVLYLSNLMKSKGVLELLDAFSELCKKHENVSLTIAGEFLDDYLMKVKEFKPLFEEKLKSIPESRISFAGPVSGSEKVRLLAQSDIFVLPTFHVSETGGSLAVLEAMRAGNAVIVTKHNYFPQMMQDQSGQLVQKESAEDLKKAIEHFILHPDEMRVMQEFNMKYARENYSLSSSLEKLKSIFDGK